MPHPDFFSELLQLPTSKITYEAGKRLAALYPAHTVLEVDHWAFRVEPFAQDGLCETALHPEVHNQHPVHSHEEDSLTHEHQNSWTSIRWDDHALELIALRWESAWGPESRFFLVAPNATVAKDFTLEVCTWNTEVRGEVLVFHEGEWTKDSELYEEIRTTSFDQLVLPGPLWSELHDDVIGFFQSEAQYRRYNIPFKRGVLLHGPPGNGKTHAIKAILNAVQKPRLYVKSFESGCCTLQENIHRVFQRARKVAPCVLVLEDLDSMLNDKCRSFFLNELDGFANNDGILLVATTNHIARLDVALVQRPSRFDRKIHFALPAEAQRLAYINAWNDSLEPSLRVDAQTQQTLANHTEGFSFAYIKELFVSSLMKWISCQPNEPMASILQAQCTLLQSQIETIQQAQNIESSA